MFLLRYLVYNVSIVFLFVEISLFSQEKVSINGVRGECFITNISPEQAKERAILEAKKEALRKAGVSEIVMSADVLYSSADGANMKQALNSFSNIELTGEVLDYTIIKETKKTDQFGNLIYEVILDVVVIKYETRLDPEFDIKIQGIEEYYKVGSKLEFSFIPFKDGYLKLFYFDGNKQCSMIFPNEYEKSRLFVKDEFVKFPLSKSVDYTMETDKEREENFLVFVFTKKEIPFTQEVNYKNLMRWINGITPDQRVVKFFAFIIKGNG